MFAAQAHTVVETAADAYRLALTSERAAHTVGVVITAQGKGGRVFTHLTRDSDVVALIDAAEGVHAAETVGTALFAQPHLFKRVFIHLIERVGALHGYLCALAEQFRTFLVVSAGGYDKKHHHGDDEKMYLSHTFTY